MHKILLITGLILAFCGIVTLGSLSVLLVLKLAVIILPLVILFKLVRNKMLHRHSENQLQWTFLRTRQIWCEKVPNVKFWFLRVEQKYDTIAEALHHHRYL